MAPWEPSRSRLCRPVTRAIRHVAATPTSLHGEPRAASARTSHRVPSYRRRTMRRRTARTGRSDLPLARSHGDAPVNQARVPLPGPSSCPPRKEGPSASTPFAGRTIGSVDDLTRAWREAEEHLPKGWHLDGLRCASTSLRPEDRSEDWIAVAVNADGEERQHRASDPLAALAAVGVVATTGVWALRAFTSPTSWRQR